MKYTDPTGYEYDSVDSSDCVDEEGQDYADDNYDNGWDPDRGGDYISD